MSLNEELQLGVPIATTEHEALLNIYFTSTLIRKRGTEFLRAFGLTEVQINVMMLLGHQARRGEGLSQAQLSDMMLVNRANITGLIDRMEKAKLVVRTADPDDRRTNIIKLTARGRRLLDKVEPHYGKEVARIMSVLKNSEQKTLIRMLEKVRANLRLDT